MLSHYALPCRDALYSAWEQAPSSGPQQHASGSTRNTVLNIGSFFPGIDTLAHGWAMGAGVILDGSLGQ